MAAVFAKLVSISIVANWLILAVILLRVLLKKAPRWIICILWALVAVRLVFPFSIESPVSLIPETTSVIQEAVDTNLIHPEVMPSDTADFTTQVENSNTYISSKPTVSILPLIWCLGVCLMLCYLVFSYLKMLWLVREAVPDEENVWLCDAVATPFILGMLQPRIYLPSGLSETNREYVIAHEQSHLWWKDHWWKPLAFILLAVYWFDPLVWIAYTMVCSDIEFACDERVVQHYGLPEKKAYSEALLECSDHRKMVLACPVAFGETAVVQRVRNVLNYKKPRFWIILISVIVILVTAIGFLTVPVKGAVPDLQEPASIIQEKQNTAIPTAPPVVQENDNSNGTIIWDDDYSDGIRIEEYAGDTFMAHVMIVRDPAKVYLATFSGSLAMDTPGIPIDEAMERENAAAAINAGPFFDDGSPSQAVGSVPYGLVLSDNAVVWNDLNEQITEKGFAGFNKDNILIVASSMTETEAKELEIRDGCFGGPVLMINGKSNTEVYNSNSGYTARTAVGQRSDGAVIFASTDGRTADSLGATYADLIDILTEYGAVNACAINSGSACNMLYRDADGRYGDKGMVQILNQLPANKTSFRRTPTFWMVKSAGQ